MGGGLGVGLGGEEGRVKGAWLRVGMCVVEKGGSFVLLLWWWTVCGHGCGIGSPVEEAKVIADAPDMQVVSSTGEEVFFKIKRNTRLSKLQAAYANKVGKDVGSIR